MRKLFILILCLFSFVEFVSCEDDSDNLIGVSGPGDMYRYYISFKFVDKDGNSLGKSVNLEHAKGFDLTVVPEDGYDLDIILGKQHPNYNNLTYSRPQWFIPDFRKPTLGRNKSFYPEGDVLTSNFFLYSDVSYPQEKMTYKLTCPIIFGDNNVHEITTYWHKLEPELQMEVKYKEYWFECYRVEFESRDCEVVLNTRIPGDAKENYTVIQISSSKE